MKNTIKKIFGVIGIIIGSVELGGVLLVCTAMILLSGNLNSLLGQDSREDFLFGVFVLVPLSIIFILLGTYLWGWKRRNIVFGIIMIVLGSVFLLSSIFLMFVDQHPLGAMSSRLTFSIVGIFLLSSGIILVVRQKKALNLLTPEQ
jgi:hypothetical protein